MTFGLIPVTIGMLSMLLSAVVPQNNVVDEEGPIVTAVSISPAGYLQVGDVLTVTLTIFDPGGSGVRNIQFSLKDRFGRQHSPFNTEDWGQFQLLFSRAEIRQAMYHFDFECQRRGPQMDL